MQAEGLTAVLLVLPLPAVVLAVAAEDSGDAAAGVRAFELAGQTHVDICRQTSRRTLECVQEGHRVISIVHD